MDSYVSYHSSAGSGQEADFQRLASVIGSNVQKISQNVNSMQRMVDQLRSRQDDGELRNDLHKIQHYTNQLAQDTSTQLQNLEKLPTPTNQSEQRQWRIQKELLTRDFSVTLTSLQNLQRMAAKNEKEGVERTRASSGLGRNLGRNRETVRGGELIQLESPVQSQTMIQLNEESNLEMLREREQALQQIEGDIVAVNQIFKDLAVLVHDQGAVIDSIEAHIDSTHEDVQQGTQQLQQARDYQSSARKKTCIIIVVVAVFLAILITVLVTSLR